MSKKVLYIEDNPDSVVFFKRVVDKLGNYSLSTYEDGISFIRDINAEQGAEARPEIIMLDINLPGMNGFEILEFLRSRSEFKHTPVIMFTSSENEQDIKRSYERGANAYLVKPENLKGLHAVIEDTFNFWLKHNVA